MLSAGHHSWQACLSKVIVKYKAWEIRKEHGLMERVKVGVSACLLGYKVRYDGGHKLDRYIRDTLGRYMEFVPVCPEVECGLGVPREPMRLVGDPSSPRLVAVGSGRDHTERMVAWVQKRLDQLEQEKLWGFIFKSGSPSSGMEKVKVYTFSGRRPQRGKGIFARAFMERFPLVPVEDDDRLHDPRIRENFIERIFVMHRWRQVREAENPMDSLVRFHTTHQYLIRSHSPSHQRKMALLVAQAQRTPREKLLQGYETLLIAAMHLKATPAKHASVLHHMLGFFKEDLDSQDKKELLDSIGEVKRGNVPLLVPLTLMKHYLMRFPKPYLAQEVYLNPHPLELMLRNHA